MNSHLKRHTSVVEHAHNKLLINTRWLTSDTKNKWGRDSSVGIAIGYGMDSPGIESR
jgi:hypothetical protein